MTAHETPRSWWMTGDWPMTIDGDIKGSIGTQEDPIILGGIYDHDITTRDDWPEFVRSIEAEYGLKIRLHGEAQ